MVGILELLIVCVLGIVMLALVGGAIYYIVKKNQPTTPDGRTCPNCGRKNPPDNNFCGSCGKLLEQ